MLSYGTIFLDDAFNEHFLILNIIIMSFRNAGIIVANKYKVETFFIDQHISGNKNI